MEELVASVVLRFGAGQFCLRAPLIGLGHADLTAGLEHLLTQLHVFDHRQQLTTLHRVADANRQLLQDPGYLRGNISHLADHFAGIGRLEVQVTDRDRSGSHRSCRRARHAAARFGAGEGAEAEDHEHQSQGDQPPNMSPHEGRTRGVFGWRLTLF